MMIFMLRVGVGKVIYVETKPHVGFTVTKPDEFRFENLHLNRYVGSSSVSLLKYVVLKRIVRSKCIAF